MRIPSEFPDGFGSDPTMMLGPCGERRKADAELGAGPTFERPQDDAPSRISSAPGPDASLSSGASYEPGPADHFHASPSDVRLDPLGFHIDAVPESEPETAKRREPPGIVITTVVVGLILAAMGYFLDMH